MLQLAMVFIIDQSADFCFQLIMLLFCDAKSPKRKDTQFTIVW